MVIIENTVLDRMTESLFVASRINDIDARLGTLEQASRSAFQTNS